MPRQAGTCGTGAVRRLGRFRLATRVAVRVGFEPTLEFPLNTLSKRAPSTTRPPHLTPPESLHVARPPWRNGRHIDCALAGQAALRRLGQPGGIEERRRLLGG